MLTADVQDTDVFTLASSTRYTKENWMKLITVPVLNMFINTDSQNEITKRNIIVNLNRKYKRNLFVDAENDLSPRSNRKKPLLYSKVSVGGNTILLVQETAIFCLMLRMFLLNPTLTLNL